MTRASKVKHAMSAMRKARAGEAKDAASIVHRRTSRASVKRRSSESAPVHPARRDAVTARDRFDAERWLDEGGSFSSEAARR